MSFLHLDPPMSVFLWVKSRGPTKACKTLPNQAPITFLTTFLTLLQDDSTACYFWNLKCATKLLSGGICTCSFLCQEYPLPRDPPVFASSLPPCVHSKSPSKVWVSASPALVLWSSPQHFSPSQAQYHLPIYFAYCVQCTPTPHRGGAEVSLSRTESICSLFYT